MNFTKTESLPAADQKRFNMIVNAYERKLYKKGLKWVDQLIKKYHDYADAISMRGLIIHCMGKKEEGYTAAKGALKIGLSSHICWHVLGLMHRSDKNYVEAMKCYKMALRLSPENQQILRDLCLLQTHIRDLDGLKATRHIILASKPSQRVSWVGLAIAYHLLGKHDVAVQTLQAYEDNDKPASTDVTTYDRDGWPKALDFEKSEMLMYKVQLLEEGGRIPEAIACLDKNKALISDLRAWKEQRGALLLKQGNRAEAEDIFRGLFDENPNNRNYLTTLESCVDPAGVQTGAPLDESTELRRLAFYDELAAKYPRSNILQRLQLNFATGDRFQSRVDAYLQRRIRKGVPTLFTDIRSLYADPAKVAVFDKLIPAYVASLTASQTFPGSSAKETSDVVLWAKFLAAMHDDKLGRTESALKHLEDGIAHTPTLIELYTAKGRVLKHAGDYPAAALALETARDLDTADRYLNGKCAKYQLRAGRITDASATVKFFLKENEEPVEKLAEMQCMWFETERGKAFAQQGDIGRALKQFYLVDKQYNDIHEDQFDFHSYCLRKMTLRSYIKLIRYEDTVRGHKFFFRAATEAIRLYLALHDKPLNAAAEAVLGDSAEDKERKKALSKQRRAQQKAQAAAPTEKPASKDASGKDKKEDKDADGASYLQSTTLLEDVMTFVRPLQQHATQHIETHLLAFEVYFRKNKPLLMLQSLKRAQRIDANNADLHKAIVQFALRVAANGATYQPTVSTVINQALPELLNKQTPKQFVEAYKPATLLQVLRNAEARLLVDPASKSQAIKLVVDAASKASDATIETFSTVQNALATTFGDKASATVVADLARKQYPRATLWK
ncbi:NMDA receptor-regulated protein 1 [Capsaspora owczarzaki ATCC 30864]|uniref:NMDA receptor-regulated protein 1 n=1 Tax=Capsaspora owczarzaki (strain ATCC 30864) TaxID=595528 RepID=A0A0D2UKE3_CAPO3|nr:NMDA receptor-regulated protein 1 [Capsaspora owczarzaki ATCC 30864]KJE95561.1 NMDA receptor-regulated protein 1 [Capsaspora owczarzaki ATCC 30864]|eukprot:XP_004345594.2 NMDA receptor-regulated protein 1 [Capsaspora owczarzaki ATCC 30864]